jgi:hypothetical protein
VSFIDSGATTGDFLSWNGTKWISTAAPATVTNGSSIGDLLRWNGSSWQPTAFVDGGTSVGDVLSWNGSKWTAGAPSTGTVAVNNGGTGQTSYTDGQLLIGNSVGNTLTKNTLTAGNGVTITNGNGSIAVGTTVTSMIIGQTASNMDNNSNTDYYFPIGGTQGNNTDPGFKKAAMRVTRNCTVKNFYVDITAAPGSGNSHNFTVRDITTGTELPMLSISGTGTSGSDLVNTLSVNAGDIIVVKHTATSTPNNAEAVWSFDLQ